MSNFCPDTGGEGGHSFRLTCSVVLRGRRDTANKRHWRVWGARAVSGPHWVCPRSRRVLSQSTLLRLQVALPGTVWDRPWDACTSQVWAAQVQVLGYSTKAQTRLGLVLCPHRSELLRPPGAWRVQSPQVGGVSYHLPSPSRSVSCVAAGASASGVPCVSSGELISGCDPPGGCPLSRIPRSWLAIGSLLAVW